MIGAPGNAEIAERAHAVEARILASVAAARSPFRYRQLRVLRQVVLAVGGVLVLGAGAGIVTSASMDQVRYSAICYTKASVNSRANSVGQVPADTATRKRPRAIDICTRLWQQGVQDNSGKETPKGGYAVPKLIECTSKDDVPAIFPRDGSTLTTDQFCAALGMRAPSDPSSG